MENWGKGPVSEAVKKMQPNDSLSGFNNSQDCCNQMSLHDEMKSGWNYISMKYTMQRKDPQNTLEEDKI